MEVLNPFILKNKIGMVKFIDELTNVDLSLIDVPMADGNNNVGKSTSLDEEVHDCAQDLAIIHKICESLKPTLANSSTPGARKLQACIYLLENHITCISNKYFNN